MRHHMIDDDGLISNAKQTLATTSSPDTSACKNQIAIDEALLDVVWSRCTPVLGPWYETLNCTPFI
jgi:hypothetical protein